MDEGIKKVLDSDALAPVLVHSFIFKNLSDREIECQRVQAGGRTEGEVEAGSLLSRPVPMWDSAPVPGITT